jgi:hypothetical protein
VWREVGECVEGGRRPTASYSYPNLTALLQPTAAYILQLYYILQL